MIQPLRHRRFSTRMWGDERFLALSHPPPNGRYLWIYLLGGPHTTAIPGLFCAGEAQLAEALGWPLGSFRRCFGEIRAQGMARADWAARVVWIPKAINHNPPQSANVIIAWAKAAEEIPACGLKQEALRRLGDSVGGEKGISQAFVKAFGEALAKTSAKPSELASRTQEQEAGTQEAGFPPKPPTGVVEGISHDDLAWLELLNREAAREFKPVAANLKPIRQRRKEGFTLEQATAVVRVKVAEWRGTDRDQYLRPETIFGGKFDSYLQQAAGAGNGHRSRRSGLNAAWTSHQAAEVRL